MLQKICTILLVISWKMNLTRVQRRQKWVNASGDVNIVGMIRLYISYKLFKLYSNKNFRIIYDTIISFE